MHCPFCHNPDSRVVDTRIADDGASIRRRRECTSCKRRFTTLETSSFQVVKRSGVVEPFSRDKVVQGVLKACQGRPVDGRDLALLAQQVEEHLRSSGVSNVSSEEVGKAILPFLADLDEIAYLRFASVYLAFNSLEDFDSAIDQLRAKRDGAPATAAAAREPAPTTPDVGADDTPAPEGEPTPRPRVNDTAGASTPATPPTRTRTARKPRRARTPDVTQAALLPGLEPDAS